MHFIISIITIITIELYSTLLPIRSISAQNPIKILVLDTGIKPNIKVPLCTSGHKDFTGHGLEDVNGHGTNVVGLIHKRTLGIPHCFIIVKFYHTGLRKDDGDDYMNSLNALRYISSLDIDILNYSAGGSLHMDDERTILLRIIKRGVIISVAAGNTRTDLDKNCNYFPACYKDLPLRVVGRKPCQYDLPNSRYGSNYGKIVTVYEEGCDQTAFGITLTGTSQATANHTGELVKKIFLQRQKRNDNG